MSAMEPIDTHEFPLSHEPIEDWQKVSPASAGGPDAVGSVRLEGATSSAGEASVTTRLAELGTIGGAQSRGSRENVMGADPLC
ncbi:hypothetical protein [Brevibacterium iodinum]|uniref:hypothetical protein n=1 Tax=Brevibacterium iodinum TaxID=31943 RepID=UPI0011AF8B56|nr:hypothetical protein [Brevibacterium iodinum]